MARGPWQLWQARGSLITSSVVVQGRVPLSLLVLSAFFAGLAYHSLTVAGWSLFKSAKPELLT